MLYIGISLNIHFEGKKKPKKQIWVPQSQISNETPHSWDSHDAATSPVPKGSHHTKRIFIFTSRVWCLWDPTQTTGKQFLHSRNHEAVRSEWSFRILGISCNCRARYFSLVGGAITILKNMKVNEKDYPIYYGKWSNVSFHPKKVKNVETNQKHIQCGAPVW